MIDMYKFEIFKDSSENICIKIFSYNENKERIIQGNEALSIIKEIHKDKIKGFYELVDGDVASIMLEDCVITIKPFYEIINTTNFNKLRKKIIKYQEKNKCTTNLRKKVSRIIKNSSKCIIPLTLTATMALSAGVSGVLSMVNDKKGEDDLLSKNKYIDYSDHGITIEDAINQKKLELFSESLNNPEVMKSENASNINNEKQELIKQNEINEENDILINLSYEDMSETDKAVYARDNYINIIEKYSNMYGLDSRLVLGIATQERGVHSNVMDDGGGTGLMQVQNEVWEYREMNAFNFETMEYESFFITPEMISDVETNIKIGCCILQNCLREMNYNIIAAIQCYNFGSPNMWTVLGAYADDTNKTIEEILNDPNDIGWMDYRTLITIEELDYVEKVLSWIGNDLNFKVLKNNEEAVSINIKNDQYASVKKY